MGSLVGRVFFEVFFLKILNGINSTCLQHERCAGQALAHSIAGCDSEGIILATVEICHLAVGGERATEVSVPVHRCRIHRIGHGIGAGGPGN